MTGGAAAGAIKVVGVFSKNARQAGKGIETTVSVKRNKMRHEDSNGQVAIYDLEARKIIHLDMKCKTYAVMTFDEMRAQVEEAQRKAAADRAKHKGKGKDEPQQVKIVPKITIAPGKGSKKLLNYTANEVKTRVDMEMQAQDSRGKSQCGDMWVSADSFVAQVKAYEEVKRFYARLAKELNWLRGAAFGKNANVQIEQPMIEYRKSVNRSARDAVAVSGERRNGPGTGGCTACQGRAEGVFRQSPNEGARRRVRQEEETRRR